MKKKAGKPAKKPVAAWIFMCVGAVVTAFCWLFFAFVLWYRFIGDDLSFEWGSLFAMFLSVPELIGAAVICGCGYYIGCFGKRLFFAAAVSCLPASLWAVVPFSIGSDAENVLTVVIFAAALAAAVCCVVFAVLDVRKYFINKTGGIRA